MPIAILLIVGLVFYSSTNQEKIDIQKNETTKVVTNPTPTSKPVKEEIKAEPVKEKIKVEPVKEKIKAEPVKEETKAEPVKEEIKAEPVKEEIKAEPVKEEIKAEPVKEEIKAEPVQELAEKELIVDDSNTNYLKIILYIIAAIGTIFGGFYLFSNRKSGSAESSSLDVNIY